VKHLLLNCDQVFDVLTRGPFPTGAPDDEAVEHHLRACHECRQLAEALRPAVSLLHEAVTGNEALDLPEYQGSLPAAMPWQQRAQKIERASAPRSADRVAKSINALRLLAASVLAAALSLLVYSATMSPRTGAPLEPRSNLAMLAQAPAELPNGLPNQSGLIRLASLRLPAACLPDEHRKLLADGPAELAAALAASGSLDALHCCTECHHAGLAHTATSQVVEVVMESCQACHRG
jgi:hypothetical protein